ncbi:MAG TPA: 16S rRNA (adenine(1518)-N(6)/adenine(1519)-N(6))-dimethyltransferase RsmA [Vicinamibacterales bacterium]
MTRRAAHCHQRPEGGTRSRPPRAKKRFGQHFLERAWAAKVADAVAAGAGETIVEIGPGRGAITARLIESAGRVIAFEIDRDLAATLRQQASPNLTVVEGDFLDLTPNQFADHVLRAGGGGGPIRVAGNLPYNAASPILFKLTEIAAAGVPLADATVMLQREVADRVLADPGSGDYGVLTVLIRHRASAERLLQLPPGAFRPPPKVHSTVIRLRFHGPEPPVVNDEVFARLTQAMFTRRRKTLANALAAYRPGEHLDAADMLALAGIDGTRRPETLSIPEIGRLADAYARAVL